MYIEKSHHSGPDNLLCPRENMQRLLKEIETYSGVK